MIEYRVKKCGNADEKDSENVLDQNKDSNVAALFSKENIVYACPDVPQQTNSFDCGVFVLQYAETFMKVFFIAFFFNVWQISIFISLETFYRLLLAEA